MTKAKEKRDTSGLPSKPRKKIEEAVVTILDELGENTEREGLLATPDRVARMYGWLTGGYYEDISSLMTTFDKEKYDQIVVLRNCEFYSLCEHHMTPFFGVAHVGYIPRDRVVGISKLARLVDAYARRFQIQERMTKQIVDAIEDHLKPQGAICIIKAVHLCMRSRGIRKQSSDMVTSAITGAFKEGVEARSEFMELIK